MLQVIIFSVLAIAIGAALVLYGYRIFLVLLPVIGFIAGFWVGASAMQYALNENFLASIFSIVIGLIVGLIAAFVAYLIYIAGVTVLAFTFGAMIGAGIMSSLGFDSGLIVGLVALAAGIGLLILTIQENLQKYFIMAIMALGGGNLVVLGILVLLGQVSLAVLREKGDLTGPVITAGFLWVLVWLGLGIAGFFYQLRTSSDYTFSWKDVRKSRS
jgi:hypothetical protein